MIPLLRYLRYMVHDLRTRSPRRKMRRGPARSKAYKAYVRTLPCCCGCGRGPSEAAHTGYDGGMGMKPTDYSCVPLWFECHWRLHNIGRMAFELEEGIVLGEVAEKVLREWSQR